MQVDQKIFFCDPASIFVYCPLLPIPDSRFPIPDSRFPIPHFAAKSRI
ncbi:MULTISPECIES: hypothetical protein [unclassified Moorena]|nr:MULTISPECIES: hypothetical protein [unclassified Moorena]NEQ16317.1 hypothetical protein [Moorena sp. SIO3E2]NEP67908.1 hypothetical protein [Moorena sp. SIO3A5]NEQ09912.1 hypothetical protein [Moorena sp. SIO4E2]NER90038.1 hypothetical protein [Moorena sp. SIO3A2]NES42905.1 hypothetical protein [Moorena sp. SIO2C4]